MRLYDNIKQYGASSVLGRVMWAHEILRCNIAVAVYSVKTSAMSAENVADWAKKNPKEADLLAETEKLIQELEDNA